MIVESIEGRNMLLAENKYTFKSPVDKLEISVLRIEPDDKSVIKGVVQMVHGMCEHKERYIDFMRYLANEGYLCVIHDHRGHGESIKDFNDRGFMYEGGYKALVEDTHEVTKLTKAYISDDKELSSKQLPYILLGHSMGSLVVRCYLKKYESDIDKLIVMGCPSKLPGMKPGLALINVLMSVKGSHAHSKLVDYIVSGSNFEKRFKSEHLSHAWLNTDKEEVAKYMADPFCNFTFTLNGYDNLVRLTMDTYSADGYSIQNAALPIRFFSGGDDPCGISKADIEKAADVIRKAGYTDVKVKTYDGLRHEILLEPEKQTVYKDILEFINE